MILQLVFGLVEDTLLMAGFVWVALLGGVGQDGLNHLGLSDLPGLPY